MIRVETDTMGTKVAKQEADFRDIMNASGDVQEFTVNVGIELKSAVLAAIVAAQDEYLRVIQSKSKKQMPIELRSSLKETVFGFIKDIDQNEVEKFRELVTG